MRHPHWHSRNDSTAKQWATFRQDLRKEVRNGGSYRLRGHCLGGVCLEVVYSDGNTMETDISRTQAKRIESFQI
jgi:hypothetical protein